MSENKFPEGIIAKKPHDNAPNFVKAKVSIKTDEFITWLKMQGLEWVNFDLKESQKGGYYFSVDDWKPTSANNAPVRNDAPPPIEESDGLPF